jgi:hypothetical protein
MEIINNDTFDVTLNAIRHNASVAFGGARIYISQKAVVIFGLDSSYKMHIAFDNDRMYLYFNKEKNGFGIRKDKGGLTVQSAVLYETLKDRNKKIFGRKFPLKKSITRINDSLTIEVLLHKRV